MCVFNLLFLVITFATHIFFWVRVFFGFWQCCCNLLDLDYYLFVNVDFFWTFLTLFICYDFSSRHLDMIQVCFRMLTNTFYFSFSLLLGAYDQNVEYISIIGTGVTGSLTGKGKSSESVSVSRSVGDMYLI